jgi:hypothetical protein
MVRISPRRSRSTSSRRSSRPYARGVHLRAVVAATAGVCAAATAHALDVTGRLPFVHEDVAVRTSMSPAQVAAWLLMAAAVSAVAACTRVLIVGVPGALVISGTPELLGRHDPGAVFEPGALMGAVVQLLLILVVAALALLLQRRLAVLGARAVIGAVNRRAQPSPEEVCSPVVDEIAAPRGPPALVVSTT